MLGRLIDTEHGFSLLEVLCATTILVVGLAALAQLMIFSTRVNSGAKTTTVATISAAQKMEQLRSLAWSVDDHQLPVSDAGLSSSPGDSLRRNTSGYCDFVDRNGRALGGGGTAPPSGAVYVRRWSIEPVPTDAANTLVFQVIVTTRMNPVSDSNAAAGRLPDEARLVSVKTRKAH
jgi:prepilin-type N-terminal cleavage/methylation domain-containing protein